MDTNTLFINILTAILSSGAIGGIVTYLFSIEIEHIKNDLEMKTKIKLEQLKADLRIAAFQQETTFARLHEKRAEVIAKLYAKLSAVHRAMVIIVDHDEFDGKASREATDAGGAFHYYYDAHKIYFDKPLCELLESFDRNVVDALVVHYTNPTDGEEGQDRKARRTDALQQLVNQVAPIRKEIEETFREILGLSPSSTTLAKDE